MKLYFHYLALHCKSQMQYKVSFFMLLASQFLTSFLSFFGIWFLLQRFGAVGGFAFGEVILCFATSLMGFSFAECFFRGFDRFSLLIANGEFDRMLTRPVNILYQVLCSQLDLSRLGKFLQAALVLAIAIPQSGVQWTAARCLLLAGMVLGSAIVYGGLFWLGASLCFFTTQGLEVINIFTDGGRTLCEYPLGIYGKEVLRLFTFVVPLSLTQYYPLLYLLGRTDSVWCLLSPLAALVFLLPCALAWRVGIAHYKSTGS